MDLFECPVCFSDMVDRSPRSLLCLHTFCSECLTKLITNRRIECPTCREITELKTNNIQELRVNFMLRQMRDEIIKGRTKSNMCQVCQQKAAIFKCKDCPQLLCETCKKKHEDILEFKYHSVFDLCLKHQEAITHLCKKCVNKLCMRCMMGHSEHQHDFVKYEQGIAELQNDAKKLQQAIKEELGKAENVYKEIDTKYKVVTETGKGLEERRKYHLEKTKEAEELLKQTERKKKQYREIKETYQQEKQQWTAIGASLNGLVSSKSGICEDYQKIKQKADQCLKDMRKVVHVEYKVPPFILADPSSGELVKRMTTEHRVKNLRLVRTLITLEKLDESYCGNDAALARSGVLFPTWNQPHHVIRLNKEGRVVARYYPEDTQKYVKGVDMYGNDIYMLQDNTITVVSNQGNITYNINRNDGKEVSRMLVKDKTTIFVSEFENPGGIFRYDTVSGSTKSVVQGLNVPTFMSMLYTAEGYRYIVTEKNAHCINVFNDEWKVLHSFGGCQYISDGMFDTPRATFATQWGTILVADSNNHRISHYTIDGQFLSHVVTDGLHFPVGICYKHPYLWACNGFGKSVNCFELTEL